MSEAMNQKLTAERLLPHLGSGRKNIRGSHQLSKILGCSQRQIGFMVNKLRQRGHLIGSVPSKGYYMVETLSEYLETRNHIAKRKIGIDKTLDSLEDSWNNLNLRATPTPSDHPNGESSDLQPSAS